MYIGSVSVWNRLQHLPLTPQQKKHLGGEADKISYCALLLPPPFRCRFGAHQAHPKRGHPSRRHHYREMQTGELV